MDLNQALVQEHANSEHRGTLRRGKNYIIIIIMFSYNNDPGNNIFSFFSLEMFSLKVVDYHCDKFPTYISQISQRRRKTEYLLFLLTNDLFREL